MRKAYRSIDVDRIDRISGLPGNVIDTILTCMPLRDAVRTSILSRKWRHNYTNVPNLVFSDNILQPSVRNKLVSVIYQVLLLHRGPITEFELFISQVVEYSDIDRFLSYLSGNAVEKLTLSILGDGIYKLPSSFYSFLQLKDLNLVYCIFKPPPNFRGFSRLTSLEFCNVTFQSEKLGTFISNCVALESLAVTNGDAYHSFIIDAPKLKYLYLEGVLNPIRFKHAPVLEGFEVYPIEDEEASAIKLKKGEVSNFELFRRLPKIKVLKMNYLFLKSLADGRVPVERLNISTPLKVLDISQLSFSDLDEVSCLLDIIRSSPNLQKLVIQAHVPIHEIDDPVLEYLKAQDYSDICLNQLREVKIICAKGLEVELEFIKLLLATSTILEDILIVPDLRNVADKGLMMLKRLLQLERASRKAKITIQD